MIRLAILGSGQGSYLPVIAEAIRKKELDAAIEIVASNKMHSGILEKARDHHLMAEFISAEGLSREAFDEEISQLLVKHKTELILLMGYMRILSDKFVKTWRGRILNVHPSLLPAHAGKMDLEVHRAVLEAGDKETGCTVHQVTEELDAGPIILQKKCDVLSSDSPETLKRRVQALEAQAWLEVIGVYSPGNILM